MKKEEMNLARNFSHRIPLIVICLLGVWSLLPAQENFTLEQAIDYALKHSQDRKLIENDIAIAEAEIDEVKATGMPQVNASVDYNYYFYSPVNPVQDFITPAIYGVLVEEFPDEVVQPGGEPETFEFSFFTKHNLSAKIDASMLLFDGSYLTGLKAARLYRDLSLKKVAIKEEEIRAATTKAYMNILIAQENEKTLDKNIKNIYKAHKEAQAFYESGFMESLDVERILLSLETLKTEKEKIKEFQNISYDLLKFQMNYPLAKELVISENIEDLVNQFSAEVNADYAIVNYDDKAQYAEIEMGQELNALNIERLKKGYLPSVRARAGLSEQLQRNNLFDGNEAGWLPTAYAGLAINIPIYDGKLKKSLIQQAELEAEKTDIMKSEFERSIDLQVKMAYSNFIIAKKTSENRKRTLEIIESIYDKTLYKFNEGVGSSIEVTQAETQLFDAQSNYINALYDLLTSKTDLDIALGKL